MVSFFTCKYLLDILTEQVHEKKQPVLCFLKDTELKSKVVDMLVSNSSIFKTENSRDTK